MASYTLTTSLKWETVLSFVVKEYNLQNETSLTNDQFIQRRFLEMLQPYDERYKDALEKLVQQKFNDADAATQGQVRTLLGIT